MNNIALSIFFIFIFICAIIIGFFILVLLGNLSAMKFLAKNGLAVFCNDIVKDCKLLNYVNKEGACWLSVPDICYSPVMWDSDGKYKNHNFLQKENLNGELYIVNSEKLKKLQELSLLTDDYIKDLTIISGNYKGNGSNLRQANFSQLRKISQTIKNKGIVKLCENGKVRNFLPICMIDATLSDSHIFKYNNREEFLNSIIKYAKIKETNYCLNKPVLLLECKTNIDVVLILLVEKG